MPLPESQGISTGRGPVAGGYRADIDGMRAIAILLVVGYHFFPARLPGGFVGVDVFFVISGYLITRIILNDFDHGTFSLSRFFARRIARIFPALVFMSGAITAFGWFAFTSDEFRALGKHLAGSSLFISNFLFWQEAGYFDEDRLFKPLLHLWSLGIEEQFYLLWPVFLLALRRWSRAGVAAIVMGAICISFGLNLYFLRAPAGFAFYMPFTRAWELLAGAAIFYMHRRSVDRMPDAAGFRQAAAAAAPWLGITLIAAAAFALDDHVPYPGYFALLPVLGAVLLIAGPPEAWLRRHILSHPLLVWFGLISYPLYLWHWPLLSAAAILDTQFPAREARLALLAAAVLLAWITYKFVELPIRRRTGSAKIVALVAAMILTGGFGAAIFAGSGLPHQRGTAALDAKFGQFQFPVSHYPAQTCRAAFPGSGWCLSGQEGPPTVALLGDSHAHQFFPGLAKLAAAGGENMLLLGSAGCPPLLGISSHRGDGVDWCRDGNAFIDDVVADRNIHTVVLAAIWYLYMSGRNFTDDASMPPYWRVEASASPRDAFARQLEITLEKLRQAGKKVVVIKQAPMLYFHPKACLARPLNIFPARDCRISRAQVDAYQRKHEAEFDRILARFPDIVTLDPAAHLCGGSHCEIFIGEHALYRDSRHLSLFGSEYLAEKWRHSPGLAGRQ